MSDAPVFASGFIAAGGSLKEAANIMRWRAKGRDYCGLETGTKRLSLG
jgi:hypothetical protein